MKIKKEIDDIDENEKNELLKKKRSFKRSLGTSSTIAVKNEDD